MASPAVFLDRDGVINRDTGYTHRIDDFQVLPGVVDGCLALQSAGFKLVVVTNQSGIARGYYSEEQFHQLNQYMIAHFLASKVSFAGVYYCPHHPKGSNPVYSIECECRKPKPGMLTQAAQEHDIDLPHSFLIGDRLSDLQAAKAAGLRASVLVSTGEELTQAAVTQADYLAEHFADAAQWIIAA